MQVIWFQTETDSTGVGLNDTVWLLPSGFAGWSLYVGSLIRLS